MTVVSAIALTGAFTMGAAVAQVPPADGGAMSFPGISTGLAAM